MTADQPATSITPVISLSEFTVRLAGAELLHPVTFDVRPGEVVAVTGESGRGKSTLLRAILGDLPARANTAGAIRVGQDNPLALEAKMLAPWRRQHIAWIDQDPATALNPVMSARRLTTELATADTDINALAATCGVEQEQLRRRAAHLSGGQQRRVALARALARNAPVILADEPLAGLHPQARVGTLTHLREHAHRTGSAIVLTGHLIEGDPRLRALLDQLVRLDPAEGDCGQHSHRPDRNESPGHPTLHQAPDTAPGVFAEVERLATPLGATVVTDLVLGVDAGEVVGITGDSGCGKTTLARALAGQYPMEGRVLVRGSVLPARRKRQERHLVQVIPQDVRGALNPRRTVAQTLTRPLQLRGYQGEVVARAGRLLEQVGLGPEHLGRKPGELSGGQRQRVAIARALAAQPAVLICDEVTSALDAKTAQRILSELRTVAAAESIALLVISHDHDLVDRWSDRVIDANAWRG